MTEHNSDPVVVLYSYTGGARHLGRVSTEFAVMGKSFCGWWMETDAEMVCRCMEPPAEPHEIRRQHALPMCRRCEVYQRTALRGTR